MPSFREQMKTHTGPGSPRAAFPLSRRSYEAIQCSAMIEIKIKLESKKKSINFIISDRARA